MAYQITTTNGSPIATVADGTVDSTSISLTLIGKNYAGYGIFLNENYVKLLENFANGIAPTNPLNGQIWFDSTGRILKVYDTSSSQWKAIAASSTTPTQPTGHIIGDLWWDTTNSQLKASNGLSWVLIGPAYTASSGQSGALVETIVDTTGTSHAVISFYIQNLIMSIVSKDTTFTPQTAIAGFATISPGINLVSTSTVAGSAVHGDVTNALSVGGILAVNLLRSDQSGSIAGQLTINNNNGLVVGGGSNFKITINPISLAVNLVNNISDTDINLGVSPAGVLSTALTVVGTSGQVLLPLSIDSTTASTGALVVTGGVGIGSTLTVGGTSNLLGASNFSGITRVLSATASTTTTNGALVVTGGTGIGGALNVAGITRVLSATASTTTTNGALVVTGGTGIGGNLNVGGDCNVLGNLNAGYITGNIIGNVSSVVTSVGTLADLTVTGTIQCTNGIIYANAGIASTSTTTGTIVVGSFGGVGVGGNVYVGQNISSAANITASNTVTAATITGVTVNTGNIRATSNLVSNIGSITAGFNYLFIGNITPMANAVGNIGSISSRFDTVHARATTASYADLAERFSADAVYTPGTVVQIGGANEITLAVESLSEDVLGVISTNPAYTMNDTAGTDTTHPAVALSGRVPVRVIGTVKKGDRLVSAGNGIARSASKEEITPFNVIGRALVDKLTSHEELILAIVKLNT